MWRKRRRPAACRCCTCRRITSSTAGSTGLIARMIQRRRRAFTAARNWPGNSASPRSGPILRTAWVYSPFGANFVKTMLSLGETRTEVSVVDDQLGNPTSALDIADALIAIARRLLADDDPALRGVFHMTGRGEASWADVAQATFDAAARHGRPRLRVNRIATADYPTPARRPANSRLDNTRLSRVFGLSLPPWRPSLESCVDRLLSSN